MFRVMKRGAELDACRRRRAGELADLALRFDLTVPLARYFAHATAASCRQSFKRYQIGPVWRAERRAATGASASSASATSTCSAPRR